MVYSNQFMGILVIFVQLITQLIKKTYLISEKHLSIINYQNNMKQKLIEMSKENIE